MIIRLGAFCAVVISLVTVIGCGLKDSGSTEEESAFANLPVDVDPASIVGKWGGEGASSATDPFIEFRANGEFIGEPGWGGRWSFSPPSTWLIIQDKGGVNEITIDGDEMQRTGHIFREGGEDAVTTYFRLKD